MKAAIISFTWDWLGGGERYSATLARFLEIKGYDTEIWWPKDIKSQIKERFDIDLRSTKFVDYNPYNQDFIARVKKTREYDLIFWVSDGSIPTSLAKKTIIHFQIPFHNAKSSSLQNKFKARFYTCVSNSFFTKSFVDKTYSVNSEVIYPPVDIGAVKPGKKENIILSLARLSQTLHAKRQDVLIEAFSRLRLPDWKLVLAGGSSDPSYLSHLRQIAQSLPIDIIPNLPLNQARQLLSKSKIFWSATGYGVNPKLFPEKVEHFGITPIEAMAAGCVPVVTKAGGHLETVTEGETGFLWETIDQLNQKTAGLAKDQKLWEKLSQAAVNRSKQFSTTVFESKFSRVI